MRLHVSAALMALVSWVATQEHPLVGTWNVAIPAGTATRNGAVEHLIGRGTLVVTAVGDSLIAQLQITLPNVPQRPPQRLAGPRGEGPVTLSYTAEAKVITGGGLETKTAVSTFTFRVLGDSLAGSVTRIIGGDIGMKDQPLSGNRAK